MTHFEMFTPTSARRGVLLLTAMIVVAVLYVAAAPPPASATENFCGVTLQPFGKAGDRCRGLGHTLTGMNWQDHERAGCGDLENSNSELIQQWTCVGAGASGQLGPFFPKGTLRGVVRNNNVSSSGFFAATEFF